MSELLAETEALRLKVLEAQATVEALKRENQALSKRLSGFTHSRGDPSHDDTFVTTNAVNALCEHCGAEVPKGNYQMHYARCIRANRRCEACSQILPIQDLKQHTESLQTNTPLLLTASEAGDIATLDLLFAHGMNISAQAEDPARSTGMHACARGESVATAQFLISRGADVNQRNAFGETPLHVAVSRKQKSLDMIAFLLAKGADALTTNNLGDSPYALAMRGGDHTVSLLFTKTQPQPSHQASLRPRSASSYRHKQAK